MKKYISLYILITLIGLWQKSQGQASTSREARSVHLDKKGVILWDDNGDWQNSDQEGNLVNNDHLDLLDYLIYKASERGIYMLKAGVNFEWLNDVWMKVHYKGDGCQAFINGQLLLWQTLGNRFEKV